TMTLESLKTNFDKLKAGCLFRSLQKENGEPENIAIGQISKELKFLQRQSEYANEIERVIKELRLTVLLIKECQTKDLVAGINRQELLAYYQGIFLTLVHQMKDKIVQLVHLMTEEVIPEKPAMENDVSVSDLLRKKTKQLQTIGIEEDIKQWKQNDTSSKIAVVLKKRTHHHHRISGLRYDKDYLNLGLTDITAQPSFRDQLTDYGKERMDKMRVESTERLFSGATSKAENTLNEIEGNVEHISAALVKHFKLPTSQEEVAAIVNEHGKMLSSFDVTNRCSVDKIPEPYKSMLNDLVSKTQTQYKEVVAIYLVGSLGRGEYEEGYSDVNVYIILDIDDKQGQAVREDFMFSLRIFSRAEFLAESSKKYRVIAKADGILMFGEDLVKDKKPKAGLLLALTLNEDILEIMDGAIQWMNENPRATPFDISKKSRRLAKRFIDFIYGVVMANKPQYTSSRAERVERINEMYPENQTILETLMGVSRYGVGEFESFKNMVEGFRPKVEMNLKKMQEVRTHIKRQDT
ncbi:MAG: nucleotidyltransferase domain-containing protein, partial [Parcubacteria group bacterium]|nr:nucleotidyltransferase domain-containing protein [Parcubacteria group bacterium]